MNLKRARGSFNIKVSRDVIHHRVSPQERLMLVDHKLFAYLLYRAGSALHLPIHRIPMRDACDFVDSKPETVIESLRRLGQVRIDIAYNSNDGWPHKAVLHFLSFDASSTRDGKLQYAFDPMMLSVLKDPRVYAKLSILEVGEFESRAGLRLYQVMSLRAGCTYNRTWTVEVDELKAVLGAPPKMRWGNFVKLVLQPAVEECNRVSRFNLKVEFIKSGRSHAVQEVHFYPLTKFAEGQQLVMAPPKRFGARDVPDVWEPDVDQPLSISAEARERAAALIGGTTLELAGLERDFSEAMTGRVVHDLDGTFLGWCSLKAARLTDRIVQEADDDEFIKFLNG
jgi:hypothetical protein